MVIEEIWRDDVLLRRKKLLDPPPPIYGTRGDEPGELTC